MQSRAKVLCPTVTFPQPPDGFAGAPIACAEVPEAPVPVPCIGVVKPGIAGTRMPFQLTQPAGGDEFGGLVEAANAEEAVPLPAFGNGAVSPGMLGRTRPP